MKRNPRTDTILPLHLENFLAMCAKRPASWEELCQEVWYYSCEPGAKRPLWFIAGCARSLISSAYGLSLWLWVATVAAASQSIQSLQERTAQPKERCELVPGVPSKLRKKFPVGFDMQDAGQVLKACRENGSVVKAIDLNGEEVMVYRGLSVDSIYVPMTKEHCSSCTDDVYETRSKILVSNIG